MKKLFLLGCVILLCAACATVQEAKHFANCKFSITGVEVSDYNVNSLAFILYFNITNLNKKHEASIKTFDGKLTMNDVPVGDVKFENVKVEAGKTRMQKAHVTVPMNALNTKLIGLVSMGSATVDYHVTGTATFDTPLGEFPMPIDIGRRGSNN